MVTIAGGFPALGAAFIPVIWGYGWWSGIIPWVVSVGSLTALVGMALMRHHQHS
jgi:hypothetical protein